MFDQYGTDYAKTALNLNSLLPAVNQSETSNSFLSTLFQRWLTKANLANAAGTVGFTKTPLASAIQESTAIRQAYQLYPIFYREQGDEKLVTDWNDILRKIAFTGVDPTRYSQWGTTSAFDFSPPIDSDKFVNYSNYYWVNTVNTIEQPDYVTLTSTIGTNDWSVANNWVHKNDLGDNMGFAKQAQLPIIEFTDVELCRWYTVHRTWKKLNVVLGEYIDTTEQPEWMKPEYVPTNGFANVVDPNWQLQSESLIPTGNVQYYADGTTVELTRPTATKTIGQYQASNSPSGKFRYRFSQYLRNQNSIIAFSGEDEHSQITNFVEVEDSTLGQYSRDIDIPATVFDGVAPAIIIGYIGAHCSLDSTRLLSTKLIKLAPGFTSFTPSTGVPLASTQHRDLHQYKLIGQRRLSKYQLPLFNLYTLISAGDTGMFSNRTTAGYILKYNQDTLQPVDTMLGQRVSTVATDLSFTLDLVSPTGELLSYYSNTDDQHFTVWKNKTSQTPTYVDAKRVPLVDTTQPGGWEPSRLMTDNPLRETRSTFTFSQVINHFQQLATNLPGTIRISDDGGNYLISSLLADNLSIPSLIDFVANELHAYRVQMEHSIKDQLLTFQPLRNTAVVDIPQRVYDILRAQALVEGGSNTVYDDTLSYNSSTDTGYPNFPLTFGILGICSVNTVDPLIDYKLPVISVESDRKLNHTSLITHDGSRYALTAIQSVVTGLENALATSVVTGITHPIPTSNFCIWRKNSTETYRFECYYFSASTPTATETGRTWYNPTTDTASVWTGTYWQGIVTNTLWTQFNVLDIVLQVFALQEQSIVELIKQRNLPTINLYPTTTTAQYQAILATSYGDFAYRYELLDNKQPPSRLLSPPSSTDPFTWHYGNASISNWPNLPDENWVSSVFELYTNLYNTPVPHKQPWKLQGYTAKPTWWDSMYLDTTGQRRWSTAMWTNIATGTIPIGRLLEDGGTGTGQPNQCYAPAVIPVNTTSLPISPITPDAGTPTRYVANETYAPDDLLPPYINITTYPTLAISDTQPIKMVLISDVGDYNPSTRLGEYLQFPLGFGQGSFIENIWKHNQYNIARLLKAAYCVDPLRVATKLTSRNKKLIGGNNGILVNAYTNNVAKNTDPLHGDNGTVDTTLFAALTFIARRDNFTSHNNSPLYAWKSWSTRLAYQTNSLIVPHTLKIYQDCYELNEYHVVLKKSENVRKIPFSNIIITLDSIIPSIISTGRGENWVFRLTCSEIDPIVRKKYNILEQSFNWNSTSAMFTLANSNETLRWFNGEHLQLVNPPASISNNSFYISSANNAIRLYSNDIDAVAGINPIDFTQYSSATYDASGSIFSISGPSPSIPFTNGTLVTLTNRNTTGNPTGMDEYIAAQVGQTYTVSILNSSALTLTNAAGVVVELPTTNSVIWPVLIQLVPTPIFTGPVQFRTVKATFTAGNSTWETAEVDRRSIQSFSFANNITVTGVQALIDFVVGYTEYMQDDGIVINAGETPALDPDTNAVISWQQQITKAVDKIFASNGLSAVGYRPVFVPVTTLVTTEDSTTGEITKDWVTKLVPPKADRMDISIPFAEINPYRSAVFFHTPDGVICNFERTPYVNEITSTAAIYDDTATPITATELIPLRTDRLTSVVFNDTQPPRPVNVNQDVSRRIAFGEISLDFYEHVLVFDQQTSNGLTIFDRFFNLQKTFLNLEFQKSVDFFYRPVMGGFSVTSTGTIPNFETAAEYQRNDYNVANSNELIQSTIDSRQMLGKLPLPYFQNIPVTSKTEFQFWQQMIREKGTKGSISAFTRHALYDDVSYDEFWAWKLGTFGAIEQRKQLEMNFKLGDVLYDANTFWFNNTSIETAAIPITTAYHSTPVYALDQSRWIDFPDYLDQVGITGPQFGQVVNKTLSFIFNRQATPNANFIYFDLPGDVFTTTAGVLINHRTLDVTSITTSAQVIITSYLPAYNEVSPLRVVDTSTKIVTATFPGWDPANNLHTNAIAQFDYVTATDPALYNRTLDAVSPAPWGAAQVGQYFLDSSSLVYKSYFDATIFKFDDRVKYWGELADGFSVTAYQWVESNTVPTIVSKDGPLTRPVLKTRTSYNCTIVGSTVTGTAPSGLPFTVNTPVVLYKRDSTAATPILDSILGIECSIQTISGNTLTLVSDGVVLTRPSAAESASLFITSTWNDATTTLIEPLICTFCVSDPAFAQTSSTFQLPQEFVANATIAIQDLTSSAIVNINGVSTPFSISATGVLTIFTDLGIPRSISTDEHTHMITVMYPEQSIVATGVPILSDPALSYIAIDVPYTEHTQVHNQLSVTKYYYWASLPTLINNPTKALPLSTAVAYLTRPSSGDYMAIHYNPPTITVATQDNLPSSLLTLPSNIEPGDVAMCRDTLKHYTYVGDFKWNFSGYGRQLLTLWGLYGTHQLDSKALAIDIDKTMRDKYFNPSISKPSNEQWVLFREFQDGYPPAPIWDSVVTTITGIRTINPTSTIIVPTPDRMSYDYLYDTTLSYGTGVTQTLIQPTRAQELFIDFFSVANPLIDSTLHTLLTGNEWTTFILKKQYAAALKFVYTNLPSTLLNSFIFVILREGLYSGYHYDGLFKTSYVALQTSQKVVVG